MSFCRHQIHKASRFLFVIFAGLFLFDILVPPAVVAAADAAALAEAVLERSGIDRGVCHLQSNDVALALHLARSSGFLIRQCEPNAKKASELRHTASQAGLGIDRILVEQGTLAGLPYADRTVDLLLATQITPKDLTSVTVGQVMRVLRPEGVAVLGSVSAEAAEELASGLRNWAQPHEPQPLDSSLGTFVLLRAPPLKGVGEWSHWEHGPDNNPVSNDQIIKAPYLTQFMAEPFYVCMPAITTAAGGRTFLATGHIAHHRREWDMVGQLIARNGYNGTILWQRQLPEGFLAHRSAFVATKDIFYLLDGDGCLMLDAATGQQRGRIEIPGVLGDWKWMALRDGIFYVMTGPHSGYAHTIKGDRAFGGWSWGDLSSGYYQKPRVPWGFGNVVAAYDPQEKRLLWKHEETDLIDSRAMAMIQDKIFLYCPEKHLRCLNVETGRVLWTNADQKVTQLIEQPGKGLTSTPGFRSGCLAVATPDALIIQGQTRMNVVAVSTHDGYHLWTKKKFTNNPNVIYVDGKAILGIGKGGSHVALDPVTGTQLEDLHFGKRACTRLTASTDSFFVRGEGTLRFDRASKKVLVDGGARPACNDGAIPANGLLYIGPWVCDCNLSLIGALGKCSAGDFNFEHRATEAQNLLRGEGDIEHVAPFEIAENDWPTYRADNQRSASTKARLASPRSRPDAPRLTTWTLSPSRFYVPTPPVAAGGLVFIAGSDGKVRAIDGSTGKLQWEFATAGPIKAAPTLWEGRVYVGSGDGSVYALEAVSGRLLWRFRAAPVERRIMVYGHLCSTWPVNTGVLVEKGVAYFAAGIIDSDGTYVYALDAKTGKIRWQNNSCGHLNPELRKGVSAQGNLAIQGERLLMAGGNQVNPAIFELATGKCLNESFPQGQPKANRGRFVGVLKETYPIAGGGIMYASPRNVANKDSFVLIHQGRPFPLNYGAIPPAWNDDALAMVNFRNGKLTCYDMSKSLQRFAQGFPPAGRQSPQARRWLNFAQALMADKAARWQSDLDNPDRFEVLALAVTPTGSPRSFGSRIERVPIRNGE